MPLFVLALLAAASTQAVAENAKTENAKASNAKTENAQPALEPGAYDVRAALQLPNIDDLDINSVRTLCLVAGGGTANHGFEVMSANNPLKGCPMVNVREAGGTLTFDIKCPGSNLAKASAVYQLMGDSFRGRIAMTMGGKNMTMVEVQEGRRTGACAPPS